MKIKELLEENEKIIKMIRGGLDNNFSKMKAVNIQSQFSEEQMQALLKLLEKQKK